MSFTPETAISASHHGINAVRALKKSHTTLHGNNVSRDPRVEKNIQTTFDYFTREVDPLIGGCITYLLCNQPNDVIEGMLTYFKSKNNNNNIYSETNKEDKRMKAKASQKIYLATQISPILPKLVNRIARERPINVADFIYSELEKMKNDDQIKIHQPLPPARTSFSNNSSDLNHQTQSNKDLLVRPESAPSPSKKVKPPSLASNNQNEIHEKMSLNYNLQFTVIGNSSSGKTSFINCVKGTPTIKVRPSLGFKSTNMKLGDKLKVTFYDLGGAAKIRGIWQDYYHDVHGLIFLVDSCSSDEQMLETGSLFEAALSHPYTAGKPVLILANKQDNEGARSVEEIERYLHVKQHPNCKVFRCSSVAVAGEGDDSIDPRIDFAITWLIEKTKREYDAINRRVAADSIAKEQDDAKQKFERDMRVLTNKIASAFYHQYDRVRYTEKVDENNEDVFTREEGVTFLGSEIGVELTENDLEALEAARLVGYQRLALQMIGAMYCPVSKKKSSIPWTEIINLVKNIRFELGL